VERIVAAAVEIADAEGLANLSMARVAESLGTTAMSLYRHVRNKDELLQVMTDVAAAMNPPPAPVAGGDWRSNLERWTRALFTLYRAHRWVLEVPIGPMPPIGPGQLRWLDRGLASLAATPLPPEVQIGVIMLLLTHVRGEVSFTQQVNQSMTGPADPDDPTYGQLLRRLVDPARLPALAALVSDGVFDDADKGISDAEFDLEVDFAVAVILDGIGALIDRFEAPAEDP
jgi:AcrR family transcriptional regulator